MPRQSAGGLARLASILAILLVPTPSPAQEAGAGPTDPPSGQRLPIVPEADCRSELEARLAFGLCPDATFDFYAAGAYREDVPRPEDVLGYPIGSWHTPYGRMEDYLEALSAAAPGRVRVFDYGESVERRTMHLVAISSEENLARLEGIRGGLASLADPSTPAAEADAVVAGSPILVWLNAANDGNETAAFEAAMQIAYQLAAGEDERTRRLREGAVTLVNLAHNPESHERFVAWYNAFVMGDANPEALEHDAPWGMSTNNNHYQIDLNRDALGLTQTETRAVAAELHRWHPQVFVDLHGQTTQMFFPPAATPVNPVYPPQLERWLETFGRANGEAFDRHGWSYYTRDVFDLYYPGYWDTYPALVGATGMTYETDGGGSKGVRWRRDDGTILTFADGIAHHFVASLTTVETAVEHREARLRDYREFFTSAMEGARAASPRSVVLLPGEEPRRAARLATALLRHGIEVRRVTSAGSASGRGWITGEEARREVPAGAYLVDLAQPQARLARTLLAPSVELPEGFRAEQLRRFARNARLPEGEREGYEFYDVTAWSLPLALGVDAVWTEGAPGLETEVLSLPEGERKAPGGWAGEVATPLAPEGGVDGRARSAYVWAPRGEGAIRLLARLLDEGFAVAASERPLMAGDRPFPRGSFIARVDRNPGALHDRIGALAGEAGVRVHAAATAFPARGPTGTGSEATRSIAPPRIAVLAGEGVGITSFGALWFTLERRYGQPFTAVRASEVGGAELSAFDVVILPSGSYGAALEDGDAERLAEWVRRGGTLIAYGGGAEFVMGEEEFGTSHAEPDTSAPPADTLRAILSRIDAAVPGNPVLPPLESPEARPDAPVEVPGAFLRARLDPRHWLTYGFADDAAAGGGPGAGAGEAGAREGGDPAGGATSAAPVALLADGLPLRVSEEGANPVVYADGEDLVVSGFAWPDNTRRTYGGRPYATVDRVGSGRVVLFAEDPVYRAVFDAPARLLMNAIYLSPARGVPAAAGR